LTKLTAAHEINLGAVTMKRKKRQEKYSNNRSKVGCVVDWWRKTPASVKALVFRLIKGNYMSLPCHFVFELTLIPVISPEKKKVLWTWGTQNSALEIDDLVWGRGQQEVRRIRSYLISSHFFPGRFRHEKWFCKNFWYYKGSRSYGRVAGLLNVAILCDLMRQKVNLGGERAAGISLLDKDSDTRYKKPEASHLTGIHCLWCRKLAACSESGKFRVFIQGEENPSYELLDVQPAVARMRVSGMERLPARPCHHWRFVLRVGDEKQFAVGGKEHELSLWEIESRQNSWTAKNVPPTSWSVFLALS
jgi:hypothetical protein